MIGFLKDYPGAFSPEEVRLLSAALDEAWAKLQAEKAAHANGNAPFPARLTLAKLIVDAAMRGERDLQSLVEIGLGVAAPVTALSPTPRQAISLGPAARTDGGNA